jgi:chromate transport protein ChrA
MLWIIFVVLFVLWLLGTVSSYIRAFHRSVWSSAIAIVLIRLIRYGSQREGDV